MILIEAGANVNTPVSKGRTPLWKAAEWGIYNLMQALINAGADVNDVNASLPALLAAANNGHYDAEKIVNLLIETGANVNMTSIDGSTALMTAASEQHLRT